MMGAVSNSPFIMISVPNPAIGNPTMAIVTAAMISRWDEDRPFSSITARNMKIPKGARVYFSESRKTVQGDRGQKKASAQTTATMPASRIALAPPMTDHCLKDTLMVAGCVLLWTCTGISVARFDIRTAASLSNDVGGFCAISWV